MINIREHVHKSKASVFLPEHHNIVMRHLGWILGALWRLPHYAGLYKLIPGSVISTAYPALLRLAAFLWSFEWRVMALSAR